MRDGANGSGLATCSAPPGRIPIGLATFARLAISGVVAALLVAACAAEEEDRVYGAPEAVEPLAPGRRVPSARVETIRGEPIDLADQVRDRGALLVFYRGGW